jgi:hypothetical protein
MMAVIAGYAEEAQAAEADGKRFVEFRLATPPPRLLMARARCDAVRQYLGGQSVVMAATMARA